MEALGYKIGERIPDLHQNVYVRLCTYPVQPSVEIVQPGDEAKAPWTQLYRNPNADLPDTCYDRRTLPQRWPLSRNQACAA